MTAATSATLKHLAWAIFMAIAVTAATTLLTFDPVAITDWHLWAAGFLGSLVRSAATGVLTVLKGE